MTHIEAMRINSMSFINGLCIELSCTLHLGVEGQSDVIFASKFTAFGKQNHLYGVSASQTSFYLHSYQWIQF